MQKFSLGLIAALVCTFSFAQDVTTKKVTGSVGVELAAPVGDLKNGWNFGFGGTAQVEFMPNAQFGLTLNSGYIAYSGKSQTYLGVTAKNPTLSQIPILGGVRYYFIPGIYVSGQAGVSLIKTKNSDSKSYFNYVPGIGVKVSVIDMTLKYMGATAKDNFTPSNVSLRVAVNF